LVGAFAVLSCGACFAATEDHLDIILLERTPCARCAASRDPRAVKIREALPELKILAHVRFVHRLAVSKLWPQEHAAGTHLLAISTNPEHFSVFRTAAPPG
jgi:hypothetical protein